MEKSLHEGLMYFLKLLFSVNDIFPQYSFYLYAFHHKRK